MRAEWLSREAPAMHEVGCLHWYHALSAANAPALPDGAEAARPQQWDARCMHLSRFLSFSLSLTHTHTHTHMNTYTHTHTHTQTISLSLAHSRDACTGRGQRTCISRHRSCPTRSRRTPRTGRRRRPQWECMHTGVAYHMADTLSVQWYFAHKKQSPRRTLQEVYA